MKHLIMYYISVYREHQVFGVFVCLSCQSIHLSVHQHLFRMTQYISIFSSGIRMKLGTDIQPVSGHC